MKKLKGLELTNETASILLENNKFLQYINEHCLDYYQFGVVASDEEAVHLESFLKENGIFETTLPLISLKIRSLNKHSPILALYPPKIILIYMKNW
ncbi:hypothetical protein H1D32_13035 [Anaerobacillus sp. CMMVII]|uniref:hypothetical protein n=1 Tax=Anaerobacillus sp. CMMVII TaxID=2755588 RepID=UPI0021B7901A|nr:hypothetical protein [Anaerobacillus sp. CMMVII]MCT8138582.1 hypothetical protein [Anaerobacillus sp. CMMVII]